MVLAVGISIEVPGLSQFINEIPDGALVSIEGDVDHPKVILARTIIKTALEQGKNFVYISSPGCGLTEQLSQGCDILNQSSTEVSGKDLCSWTEHIRANSVVLIDSFSYLVADQAISKSINVLETIRIEARKNGAIVLMFIEDGLLPKELGIMQRYHSDGIVQFLARDSPDGVSRFIRINKWMTGESYDRNIYYNYKEGKINVDLRYRVV